MIWKWIETCWSILCVFKAIILDYILLYIVSALVDLWHSMCNKFILENICSSQPILYDVKLWKKGGALVSTVCILKMRWNCRGQMWNIHTGYNEQTMHTWLTVSLHCSLLYRPLHVSTPTRNPQGALTWCPLSYINVIMQSRWYL
jgi:hypothetical protein